MVVDDNLNKTLANMRSLGKIIGYNAALAVAEGVVALFATAQERVPVDTGELRESGAVVIELGGKPEVIATGNEDGSIDADLSKITPSRFKKLKLGGYEGVQAEVSYFRMSSRSSRNYPAGTFDVAVYTHENLVPAPGAWKQGVWSGTQGKYLESAYIEHKDDIVKMIRAAVKDTNKIKKYIKTTKVTGKFTVESVDINF